MRTWRPPVIERHSGIFVVREDLAAPELPSGKLRGVIPWFAKLKADGARGVVNHATSHSNSHAIVSFAAREVGLEAISVVNCTNPTPQTKLAESFGGDVRYWDPMRLNVLRARCVDHSWPEGFRRLPWALCHWDALKHVSSLVDAVPTVDYHVVALGGGGYAAALARGLRRYTHPKLVGVVTSSTIATNRKRIGSLEPLHKVEVRLPDGGPVETPFPSDPTYEWVAWPTALELAARGHSVCFWSVGTRLTGDV